jgi:EAL domain-containing protein (putative c-di-GMP-specific phosphodiesterase class I)
MNMHNRSNKMTEDASPHGGALRRLMSDRGLHSVYQPILDVRKGNYLACEALIRGPEGSELHAPGALFAAAAAADCTHELEWLAVETAIVQFAAQQCALRLFLNMSISCLHASRKRLVAIRQELLRLGVPPSRIVIELTENESVTDFSDLQETLPWTTWAKAFPIYACGPRCARSSSRSTATLSPASTPIRSSCILFAPCTRSPTLAAAP